MANKSISNFPEMTGHTYTDGIGPNDGPLPCPPPCQYPKSYAADPNCGHPKCPATRTYQQMVKEGRFTCPENKEMCRGHQITREDIQQYHEMERGSHGQSQSKGSDIQCSSGHDCCSNGAPARRLPVDDSSCCRDESTFSHHHHYDDVNPQTYPPRQH